MYCSEISLKRQQEPNELRHNKTYVCDLHLGLHDQVTNWQQRLHMRVSFQVHSMTFSQIKSDKTLLHAIHA